MTKDILVGVDIGGTKTAIVLSSGPPEILSRTEFPTNVTQGPESTLQRIVDTIREMVPAVHLEVSNLKAIGVSCGNPLDPVEGIIQGPPNLPGWRSVPIGKLLSKEFGVDCFVENDANAGALAEHRFGAGRGTRNMAFLTMGTGLGAGLILNGRLYRGSSYAAGEIGHVRLTRSGPIGYYKAGSAEGWASGAGMAKAAISSIKRAQIRGESTVLAGLSQNGNPPISAKEIWTAAQDGDPVAQKIVRSAGSKLGLVLALLIDLLNPECIVIGGLVLRMGQALLEPALKTVQREALHASAKICKITAAELGERIGDVAALCIATGDAHSL